MTVALLHAQQRVDRHEGLGLTPVHILFAIKPLAVHGRLPERVIMSGVIIACVVIAVVAALVVYVVRAVKPKRVILRAGVWKIVTFAFEADEGGTSKGLPSGDDRPAEGNDATPPAT